MRGRERDGERNGAGGRKEKDEKHGGRGGGLWLNYLSSTAQGLLLCTVAAVPAAERLFRARS